MASLMKTSTPPTSYDVFISFKFGTAMKEAKILRCALCDAGVSAFICEAEVGTDIKTLVVRTITSAKLVVVLGTADYGMPGTVKFSTKEELDFIESEDKPYFLIKMCESFLDDVTRFTFRKAVAYRPWTLG